MLLLQRLHTVCRANKAQRRILFPAAKKCNRRSRCANRAQFESNSCCRRHRCRFRSLAKRASSQTQGSLANLRRRRQQLLPLYTVNSLRVWCKQFGLRMPVANSEGRRQPVCAKLMQANANYSRWREERLGLNIESWNKWVRNGCWLAGSLVDVVVMQEQ